MKYSDKAIDEMCDILWPFLRGIVVFGNRRQYCNKSEIRGIAKNVLEKTDQILVNEYIKVHPGIKGGISL